MLCVGWKPCTLCDVSVVRWPAVRHAVVLTFWNHLLYILPVSVAQCVWMPNTELPTLAPRLWDFGWQQAAALVLFDAEYYVWHYLHHRVRWLYRHVHSVHHQYSRSAQGLLLHASALFTPIIHLNPIQLALVLFLQFRRQSCVIKQTTV